MKKRFLPFSLLLVIMILGQSLMADQGGHYVPRVKDSSSAEAFISSMRVNQHTGMIDPAWLIAASNQAKNSEKSRENTIYWKSMGPDTVGGRTTSIVFDNANPNWAYIGSMGGGVFYTWNKGISWHQISDNLMVSCMAQAEDGTIYVGTGDCGVAYDYNGLADINYGASFIGSGLYALKGEVMDLVPGTSPDANDPDDGWGFINDVAVDGDIVIVATQAGLKYLENGEWKYAQHIDAEGEKTDITGNAIEVKVGADSNHTIVASVEGKLYIGQLDGMVCKSADNANDILNDANVIDTIGTAAGLLDVAIVIDDETSMIYAATVDASGNHVKFYLSEDLGETWNIILPTPGNANGNIQYQVYGGMGIYNHGIVVDPKDPNRIYVTANEIWMLERPTTQSNGYYLALQLSSASYIHKGINVMVFDPRPEKNMAYVGTDGGIYKAVRAEDNYFSYTNCNRGYTTSRCLAVAPSGKVTRVIGSVLDYGPVLIEGDENTNTLETGDMLMTPNSSGNPTIAGAHYGVYTGTWAPGVSAVSLIQPKALFMTTKDGGLYRTEDGGTDYDFANFTGDDILSITFTGLKTPMAYWESFNDEFSAYEVLYKCTKDQHQGDVVQILSDNGHYPFDYTLPVDMHYDTVNPSDSDSLYVKDIVTTKMAVFSKSSNNYNVYYTLDALHFDRVSAWYNIATIPGKPTCAVFSEDGDNLFIGTLDKGVYRVSNLRHAVDSASCTSSDSHFAPVLTSVMPATTQCVTSVAVYTDDANKLVVTLGNYGNENYVLYSDNALSDEPTFAEKQGNLPKMPVYSSVYTSTYDGASQGDVLIGTEHGVYRTTNIAASNPVWTLESANMGDVPVMDLKQQLIHQETEYYSHLVDTVLSVITYPGTNNQGVIYAATYGRGLFRCETYRQHSGASVPEAPVAFVQNRVNMYPNPVRDEAKVRFQLNENTNVSYQVFDMSGRLVKTESLGYFTEGIEHEVNVTMNGLATGAYVLRLNAGSQTSSVKFMVY